MKRIATVMAILLCSLAITTIVFAQQLKVEPIEEVECIEGWGGGCIIPPEPVPPRPPRTDYTWYEGAAVNKYNLKTEPVWFETVRQMGYPWKTYGILMIDYNEFYVMEEIYNSYDWRTGTRILKYRVLNYRGYYDGSVMILIEKRSTRAGTFKNYIINMNRMGPYPIILEREVQPVFEQAAKQMSEQSGIGVESIIATQTSQ